METDHASRYYIQRKGSPRTRRAGWLKLSLACHRASHLFAGAVASQGPSQDSPQLAPLMHQATQQIVCTGLLADAQHKRRLGCGIQARSLNAQIREGYLRVITHNLMILK